MLLSLCVGQYGRWSTDSCRVVSDNGATTHCVCTQLGHFSLLFVSDTAKVHIVNSTQFSSIMSR